MNLTQEAREQINDIINAAYARACKSGKFPATQDTSAKGGCLPDNELQGAVEVPREAAHGDFAATHAMAAAKKLRMPPGEIAQILADNIDFQGTDFASVTVAGAGFLNFRLSGEWFGKALRKIEQAGDGYGRVNDGAGCRVMVEFVSANPTGPMTVGNARGGALGDTLASVLEKAGYDVWREFYLNDTGNQVDLFAKSIEARYLQLCPGGKNTPFPEDGYHGGDITELAAMIFEKEGTGLQALPADERRAKLAAFGLSCNTAQMKQHLERYRIEFDEWFSEKAMHDNGYVAETVNILSEAGLLYEKDGALWLRNTDLGGEKDEVLRKSNGFYTYYAADIAYHRNKLERGFDKVIDIWGADHHGHAKRLLATMRSPLLSEALGIDGSRLHFLLMQMMRIVRGSETVKVSKRTGKALTLSDLLDEISADACRFFFNARADSQIVFDMELAIRQDSENPVYYVQYAHARICSLLATLAAQGNNDSGGAALHLLTHGCEHDLIRALSALPEEISLAARDLDPSRINRYAVELASRFHKFYTACRIKGEKQELLAARLKLAEVTGTVIRICLDILGVTAPENM